jgi:hypothetical protein
MPSQEAGPAAKEALQNVSGKIGIGGGGGGGNTFPNSHNFGRILNLHKCTLNASSGDREEIERSRGKGDKHYRTQIWRMSY